jgi:hypothetical protein
VVSAAWKLSTIEKWLQEQSRLPARRDYKVTVPKIVPGLCSGHGFGDRELSVTDKRPLHQSCMFRLRYEGTKVTTPTDCPGFKSRLRSLCTLETNDGSRTQVRRALFVAAWTLWNESRKTEKLSWV